MNSTHTAAASPNGASVGELFELTDEQILEIPAESAVANNPPVILSQPAVAGEAKNPSSSLASDNERSQRDSSVAALPQNDSAAGASPNGSNSRAEAPPPKWLAEMMADSQAGAEARELWSGVQQARQEAAAFREVFAKPEEARAAAERARTLDEIDGAFYDRAGNSPEEASAARAALAQRLMREDPAAFREMVFAGLRALEEAGTNAVANGRHAAQAAHVLSTEATQQTSQDSSRSLGMTEKNEAGAQRGAQDAQVAAYREFERSANEDLERRVGGTIQRTIEQALPGTTRAGAGLHERLAASVRGAVDAALRSDRQLGEQVAQVLASRRFDDATRAQVVRLINDRAQQLVPGATRQVIGDWTQTTLAAHRAKTQRAESDGVRADFTPAEIPRGAGSSAERTLNPVGASDRRESRAGRVDYRKLSDEQILNL